MVISQKPWKWKSSPKILKKLPLRLAAVCCPGARAVDESWHLAIMPDSDKNSQPPIRTEITVFTLTVSLFYPTQKCDYLSEINLLENLVTVF